MMYIKVDHYVMDVLMRDLTGHDKKPSAFIVYLYLWYRTLGSDLRTVRVSHRQMSQATGLSKSAVQEAVKWLVRRRLIRSQHASRTAVPQYTLSRPWRRG